MLLEMNQSPHRSEGNYLHSAQKTPIFQPLSALFGIFVVLLFCFRWKEYIKVIAKGRTLAWLTNCLSTMANHLLLNY